MAENARVSTAAGNYLERDIPGLSWGRVRSITQYGIDVCSPSFSIFTNGYAMRQIGREQVSGRGVEYS